MLESPLFELHIEKVKTTRALTYKGIIKQHPTISWGKKSMNLSIYIGSCELA